MEVAKYLRNLDTAASSVAVLQDSDHFVIGLMDGQLAISRDDSSFEYNRVFKKSAVRNIITARDMVVCSSAAGHVAVLDGAFEPIWKVKICDDAISALCFIDDLNQLAVGTDSGDVIVVDFDDLKTVVFSSDLHDDFIPDLIYNGPKKSLISVSGDGSLKVFDLKRAKQCGQSEGLEEEMLCAIFSENSTRIYVGTERGTLNVFNWGFFGVPSQRLKGLKSPVNCIVDIGGNTLIAGTAKGSLSMIKGGRIETTTNMADIGSIEHLAYSEKCGLIVINQDGDLFCLPLGNVFKSLKTAPMETSSFLDGFAD